MNELLPDGPPVVRGLEAVSRHTVLRLPARPRRSAADDTGGPQSFQLRRFRFRGAVGTILLVPAALATMVSEPLVTPGSWSGVAIFTLAWMAFVAGAAMRFWATAYVGGRKERELVTDGPYAICRHPLYLGSILLGVSAGLFLESPAVVIAVLVGAVIYVRTTITAEEEVLRARHGVRHELYVRMVPRLLPRTITTQVPARLTIDVHRMWLECLRASRWMWLPVAGSLVAHLRYMAWWPKVFRFL